MNNPKHYSCGDEVPDDLTFTLEKLSLLQPGHADAPQAAPQALAHVKAAIQESPHSSMPDSPATIGAALRSLLAMNNRRWATAVATLIFMFAIALSFPSVRAAASDFLSLFRVQKFAAVSVSPQQMALLEQLAGQGIVPGEITFLQETAPPTPVESIQEAAMVLGRDVQTISSLGQPQDVHLSMEAQMEIQIDLAGSRAILEAAGVDPALLPDNLDGQVIDVTIFAGANQFWSEGVYLAQMPSPQVIYPAGLQPQVLGEAMLQVVGMSPAEATRLASDIDWTSTLVLPVPQEMATFNEVTINGSSGLALSSLDGQEQSLVWQQDGNIYLLASRSHSQAELLRLTQSLR
ncbi:MAG: hypothetical protein R6X32_17735 [Chloroflexota bacterium]